MDELLENKTAIAAAISAPVPPKTTLEQDLRTASQRRVNMVWELTQAGIALFVVLANIAFAFALLWVSSLSANASASQNLLANAFFLVIGFYFGRTNHARIGDDSRNTGGLDTR